MDEELVQINPPMTQSQADMFDILLSRSVDIVQHRTDDIAGACLQIAQLAIQEAQEGLDLVNSLPPDTVNPEPVADLIWLVSQDVTKFGAYLASCFDSYGNLRDDAAIFDEVTEADEPETYTTWDAFEDGRAQEHSDDNIMPEDD